MARVVRGSRVVVIGDRVAVTVVTDQELAEEVSAASSKLKDKRLGSARIKSSAARLSRSLRVSEEEIEAAFVCASRLSRIATSISF